MAAAFDKESGVEVSSVVADVAEKLRIGKGDAAEATIQERLMPFVQEVLPGRTVTIECGGKDNIKLGPGGRNGISSDTKKLPQRQPGEVVKVVAKVPQGANGILESKTVYAEPEGWGIISGKYARSHSRRTYTHIQQTSTILSKLLRPVTPLVSSVLPSAQTQPQ